MINTSRSSVSRSRNPEATRAALIDAAAEEFGRFGFDGTRTRSVAARAAVNQALIRYHFGGKEGLYRAVIIDAVDEVRGALTAIRASTAPAEMRLRRFVETLSEIVQRKPHFPAMLLREYLSGGDRLTPKIMAQVGEFFTTSRQVLGDGIDAGEFRPLDAHAFHLVVVGSLVFFFASRPWRERAEANGGLPASAPTVDDFVRQFENLVLGGILTGGGRNPTSKRSKR